MKTKIIYQNHVHNRDHNHLQNHNRLQNHVTYLLLIGRSVLRHGNGRHDNDIPVVELLMAVDLSPGVDAFAEVRQRVDEEDKSRSDDDVHQLPV